MTRIASGLSSLLCAFTLHAAPDSSLWFDRPADSFHSSLPLGNGRIGAMVFGGIETERIVLNESSVWSGSVQDADRPDAHQSLPEIRKLLLAGKNDQAEELVNQHFTCQGLGSALGNAANAPFGCYQVLGNLHLRFPFTNGQTSGYRRMLDLSTGQARITYVRDGVTWNREHLVSAPDEVFASRLSTSKPGALTFSIALDRPERFTTTPIGNSDLLITGTLNDGHGGKGVTYAARLRVITRGGSVRAEGNQIHIQNADEATLYLTAATDYRGFAGRNLADPLAATLADLDKAAAKSFQEIAAAQRTDHAKWFDRVKLKLPETPNSQLPTDRRLEAFAKGAPDPSLAALYFNFGRHLLISSSRPGGLPPNLQGIWAEEIQTPWNGDWHLDINVQMNYWPAEVCDLSELHKPLHKLIESLVEPGRKTARAYYNSRGWIAHVFTTPWGFTSPGESASWGATVSGSAWLCQHLWEHYLFTGDKQHLRRVYPILKESCLFYLDNLIEEPKHRWLVTGPSNSPENRFTLPNGKVAHVCLGPTVDMQLLRELFANTIRTAEILGLDPELRAELSEKRKRLAPNLIGPDGRLQEWLEPYHEPEPNHRHTSPLYGLHPGYEITRRGTPELAESCRKLLEARGDDSTGWALAWRMNKWARLGDGDRAMKLFKLLLRPAGKGSGSLPNLFGSCPPFQIDANFGGCAGVAEMLVQSHASEIELLPALPKDWPDGSVSGLKTRGGFRVSLVWKAGELTAATLQSTGGGQTKVRYRDRVTPITLKPGETFRWE